MLRRTRITPYGKLRQLPKLRHSDHSGDIWSISNPDFSYLDIPPSAQMFSFSLALIWVIVESSDIIGCDCWFFLNTMYMLVCTVFNFWISESSPSFFLVVDCVLDLSCVRALCDTH